MKNNQTPKIIYAALFSALTFVGTQFIRVPLPFGYFNFSDFFVILTGIVIGGPYAIVSAAIGSALADIISGYAIYAPATFIIKSLMVASVIWILKRNRKKYAYLVGACVAELIMVFGYYLYDSILYSFAGALVSLSGNLIQAVAGLVSSAVVITWFQRTGFMNRMK